MGRKVSRAQGLAHAALLLPFIRVAYKEQEARKQEQSRMQEQERTQEPQPQQRRVHGLEL
ncbi:MAG TPA: hypothetical protein VFE17_04335 [Candidatus Baltobacteraceae bacterium]|nr:hypothetical protein [Candidatus Baltobacteraceae bacterium]